MDCDVQQTYCRSGYMHQWIYTAVKYSALVHPIVNECQYFNVALFKFIKLHFIK